ncbi:hypothetical protein NCC49_001932 [Naganishia albida]|nr:hypothetical protein NCC49_001932 [Naganishia albida]
MAAKTLLDQIEDLSEEDDNDFIPSPRVKCTSKRRLSDASSGSASSDSDLPTDVEHNAKKVKMDPTEQERKEVQVQEDFRSILDVEEEARRERERGLVVNGGQDMAEIRRPRLYAGETIYETVRLPRDHPDVQKYGSTETPSDPKIDEKVYSGAPPVQPTTTASPTPSTSNVGPSTATPTTSSTAAARPTKAPLRRKPRQSLESMNAALVAASKGKKMTTIEKSAHDWSAHTSRDATLAEQLAANRKENGGGFLEKTEFLGRVGERRDELLEKGKSRGRR